MSPLGMHVLSFEIVLSERRLFARQGALEKPVAPWEEQCGCLSARGCCVTKAERCRGTLEKLCGLTTLRRACFSSCPCACAPHWFGNYAGSVLLSICMLTLRNTGENEQEQCRKPESQRSKVSGPGCMWSDSGFNDVLGISSSAVVMFLVEEVQRNIFDQRCVENELWNR